MMNRQTACQRGLLSEIEAAEVEIMGRTHQPLAPDSHASRNHRGS